MQDEIQQIREELKKIGNKERAENSKKYLKSPYEFYGIRIPEIRKLVKKYKGMEFHSALNLFDELWNSGNHEEMSFALYLLGYYVKKYPQYIWKFLLERIEKAKTWDHVDELSAHILGVILADDIRIMSDIKEMSEAKNPWIRRISIVSTYPLIKKNKIELTLRLAEDLIYDKDIYVQKGAGWMLREAGKKNRTAVREFILIHLDMKPNAFSYATEKMTELRKIKKEKTKQLKEIEKAKMKKIKEEAKEKLKREKEEMKEKMERAEND
jgi:3-methyladenine DNA glycosylase AlkD